MPKQTRPWKKQREIERYNKKEYRFYLFCEGEKTEPNYFRGFKELIESNPIYREMVLIEIVPCGAETMQVISMAEEYVKRNGIEKAQIWCIYDKDSFPNERFNGVVERAESLNKINADVQYHTGWSNECIEYWFILYFEKYESNNARTEYIKFLDKKFKDLGYSGYSKNMVDLFHILQEYGREDLAIRRARERIEEMQGNPPSAIAPGTKVYELVEELRKYIYEKK